MKTLHYKNKKLMFNTTPLDKIVKGLASPSYLYFLPFFRYRVEEFQKALLKAEIPSPLIAYALKANPGHKIVKEAAKLKLGADIVSQGELERAIKCGIKPSKIIFSGVGKTEKELKAALLANVKSINVESKEELFTLAKLAQKHKLRGKVAFRFNPNLKSKTHAKISTGSAQTKFGLSKETILEIMKSFPSSLDLVGLSIHIGSQINTIKNFEQAFASLIELANTINQPLQFLDFGGGVGINYHHDEVPLSFDTYAFALKKKLAKLNIPIKETVFEPGRSLVAQCGLLVSRVVRIKKEKAKTFVILDAGMNDLVRPAMYDSYHEIYTLKLSRTLKKVDVVGPICETSDLFAANRALPSNIKEGDVLILADAGAYGISMASTYNLRSIPTEFFIK